MQVTSTLLKTTRKSIIILAIPLVLSAFTHLWNPIGFPSMHYDEGHYTRRALHVLEGLGPQESTSRYDHPYFGQLFLAGVFRLIGYPGLLDPKPGDVHSIEMLYMVPRVLMGLLAVVDTFLIYKIAEVRYNRKVAFIASILFAVMPITWLTRRIVLDSILMPFLLSSILFAVYYNKKNSSTTLTSITDSDEKNSNKKNIPIILLSGIFLGLAIFTKIPAFTMIPLVGYLIYTTKKKDNNATSNISKRRTTTRLKTLGLWFIPVILIPLIWPAYAVSVGQFDEWYAGLFWQATDRSNAGLLASVASIFKMDPVLVVLAMAGFAFAAFIKRDFFLLLWIVPFIIFLYFIHWTVHFHWIPVLPVFCIVAATLIIYISKKLTNNNKKIEQIFLFAIISAIGIFGLISTTMIITTNISSFQVKAMAFATKYMEKYNKDLTIISGAIYSWIPKYIFHKDNVFLNYKENDQTIKTSKALLMVDRFFKEYITDDRGNVKLSENIAANAADNNLESYWYNKGSGSWIQADLGQNNIICGVKIAWYNKAPQMSYDYVISVSSDGSNFRDVYSGISHTRTYFTSEKYDFVDTIGRYVRITVNGNAYNNVAAISEINVYGHSASMGLNSTSSSCKSLEIVHIMAGVKSGYIPANTIFKGYKPTKSQKSYPYRLGTLYNNTKLLADFEGISQYYDLNKYPYTNIGNSIGGSFVEIRPNY